MVGCGVAGYGMVLPMGLLGPEANAVRYRARSQAPAIHSKERTMEYLGLAISGVVIAFAVGAVTGWWMRLGYEMARRGTECP
jgi:hypothetical protein